MFDQLDHALGKTILHIAVNTVWISALLHGLTGAPGAMLYADPIKAQYADAEIMSIEHPNDAFERQAKKLEEGKTK